MGGLRGQGLYGLGAPEELPGLPSVWSNGYPRRGLDVAASGGRPADLVRGSATVRRTRDHGRTQRAGSLSVWAPERLPGLPSVWSNGYPRRGLDVAARGGRPGEVDWAPASFWGRVRGRPRVGGFGPKSMGFGEKVVAGLAVRGDRRSLDRQGPTFWAVSGRRDGSRWKLDGCTWIWRPRVWGRRSLAWIQGEGTGCRCSGSWDHPGFWVMGPSGGASGCSRGPWEPSPPGVGDDRALAIEGEPSNHACLAVSQARRGGSEVPGPR